MNPYLKDMNVCCEFGAEDRPEAWFTAPQPLGIELKKAGRQYILVNPVHHYYKLYPNYCIVALFNPVDSGDQFRFDIVTPGNKTAKLFYSFTDSSLIYLPTKEEKQFLIDTLAFDSATIKGKRNSFTFTAHTSGNYLMFMLQDADPLTDLSYSQHLEFLGVTPLSSAKSVDPEAMVARKMAVYNEDRAHFYDRECPRKTLIR
jgi:hypothetical protein